MTDKLQSDTASKAPVKLQHASKIVLIFFVYISSQNYHVISL